MRPPEQDGSLPSFLIIGAIKAATTWLSNHLRKSSGVFLPATEPHYFTRQYGRGVDWYRNFFATAVPGQIIGEKTADYLANPEAPKRAATLLPHANLIVSLRNPVERAYSDYCMLFRRGTVSGRIEDYLDPDRAEFRRFLDNGLYHKHLSAWLDHYAPDRMLVLTMEDVIGSPDASLKKVARLIGLTDNLIPAADSERVNDSTRMFLPLEIRRFLSPLKTIVAPLRGTFAFEAFRANFARPIVYPPLPTTLRKKLADFYRDDLDNLQKLLNRDLSSWSDPRCREAA